MAKWHVHIEAPNDGLARHQFRQTIFRLKEWSANVARGGRSSL
ncbi:hypothetical protein SFHH103_psfHH103d_554 (plasmid) [Sinorhizobium fredii HH103]|uniref:Uncharacterized protein n=1 Tax=Sinorhizobium fredii (strain USDA 257) TaxID=1185652 RepID=I3XFY2_SINF2|nr:hypothetical protein USDA257_p00700 [Sinorhizobium fredii USDA 257]CCE99076.1 hypothetical protein SFHH103_04602 [Sinorhizobium fredii HH103]CEO91761.1 hypothetical protein SFHH103_psfHH103d_554 [Sinorhizobium fredii HH103]